MLENLNGYLIDAMHRSDEINADRKALLNQLAQRIFEQLKVEEPVRMTFICTHNSRRSHFGQVWSQTAAHFVGVNGIETFSGGTEATELNGSAVKALLKAGFQIEKDKVEDNPTYTISLGGEWPELICFSKVYSDPINPDKDYLAIMTCSQADNDCPVVPGAKARFALTYEDPKISDGTLEQESVYDERCQQIATEMCYLFNQVKERLDV